MEKSGFVGSADWSAKLWLVGCCAFASMASMRICDAMLPSLAQEFATTSDRPHGPSRAFALAYGVLQLFYGPLGDRYGKVRRHRLCDAGVHVGSAAAALSPVWTGWSPAARFRVWPRPESFR